MRRLNFRAVVLSLVFALAAEECFGAEPVGTRAARTGDGGVCGRRRRWVGGAVESRRPGVRAAVQPVSGLRAYEQPVRRPPPVPGTGRQTAEHLSHRRTAAGGPFVHAHFLARAPASKPCSGGNPRPTRRASPPTFCCYQCTRGHGSAVVGRLRDCRGHPQSRAWRRSARHRLGEFVGRGIRIARRVSNAVGRPRPTPTSGRCSPGELREPGS